MQISLIAALALTVAACAGASAQVPTETTSPMVDQKPLTIERLYASPSLSGPAPSGVQYSPDGKRVTFLKARADEASRYDLWQFDVATGEQSMLVDSKLLEPEEVELSEEEKALRERKRIAGRKGIVDYDWGTADTILVPLGGDLHLVTLDADGPSARQLTQTDAFEYDAKVSPGGKFVSFVRDGAVYAIDLASGEESRLTPRAEPENAISYGVAEFVAQEEMSRYTGYWWSPNSRYLAYTKVNESTVDIIPRFDIRAEDVAVIEQRYPRAGRPNAIVDLFVRDMETGDVVEVDWRHDDWGPATDQYLARVNWGGGLMVQSVNRDQTLLQLIEHNFFTDGPMKTGFQSGLLDQSETWINLSKDFKSFGEWGIIYSTEQDGFRHLRYRPTGSEAGTPVTEGEWSIDALLYTDGLNVFFTGYEDTPLERHFYQVQMQGHIVPAEDQPIQTTPTRITELGKSWSITMSPDGQSFVGTSSSPTQPSQTGLYKADGSLITWIEENALNEDHPYAPYLAEHTVPEYGTLTAEDGQTLYYSIQLPPSFDPSKKYPALVEVYGGPHVQTVTRNWERLSDQFYSREGYVVFRLDNRGSSNRGKKFEDVIYRQTGGPEVRDQLLGVEWLKSQPFIDADRVGIQGWSYGGYMTLMTILQAPEGTFAAAVAGAPVTDWSLYDTFYTERYMDTPQDNPDGYEKSSVFYHLDRLEGELTPLMLIHGMADDNVTFDNTTRLMAELQEKGLMFDLMTYPGQRHGIRGEALQVHLMKTRMAFLDRKLKDGE
jgi:dipeptidyl-peptidase-4